MTLLRYFGNTWDPRNPYADRSVNRGFGETQEEAIRRHHEWLRDKLIGDPQGTAHCSAEQLRRDGLVGVYSDDIDEYAKQNPDKLIVNYDGPFYPNPRSSMKVMVGMGRYDEIPLGDPEPCIIGTDEPALIPTCVDCNGKGTYQGFNTKLEACKRCGGTGNAN